MDTRTTVSIVAAVMALAVLVGERATRGQRPRNDLIFIGTALLIIAACFQIARILLP